MIQLYDTRQRKKVEFVPVREGSVSMYVCGPTVYNRIHIGNARTFLAFDTIRRYLMWRGFDVTFVQNVTDVDDKIINRAAEEGRTPEEVALEYTDHFIEDMHRLGVLDPDVRPHATEEIESMQELVATLIDAGHAYEVDGDVYFSVRSYPAYGSLSGRDIDAMESGHRELRAEGHGIEERKRDPLDFALWKAAKPGEPSWVSPWGQGRPGWHIECSAMAKKYLGLPFDIHGGGSDLVFPHHENERAQSEAAFDVTFARYWMHSGMLQINAEKMSKSTGNFLLLSDVLETVRPQTLRLLTLQTHYRSPLDFSESRLEEAEAALSRIENVVRRLSWLLGANDNSAAASAVSTDATGAATAATLAQASDEAAQGLSAAIEQARSEFIDAMDDDFNAPAALGAIFTLVSVINAQVGDDQLDPALYATVQTARNTVVELMGVLGIEGLDGSQTSASQESGSVWPHEVIAVAAQWASYAGENEDEALDALLGARAEARLSKAWSVADGIRDGLKALGIVIEDTPQGQRVAKA